jgi:hypothetical protein
MPLSAAGPARVPRRTAVLLGGAALLLASPWLHSEGRPQLPPRGTPAGVPVSRLPAPVPASASTSVDAIRPTLDRYCVSCHSDRLKTAGLSLQTIDTGQADDRADVWEKVARKLRTREMPPPAAPRPDERAYVAAAATLEHALDAAAAQRPRPGRVAVHRLNRTEYANAVRDLLGLELAPSQLLPADEPDQQTFDNVASVLSVSPALLENYLSAAYRVSRLAVADGGDGPLIDTHTVPLSLTQDDRVSDDLPFGSQGGTALRHHFAVSGDYTIAVTLRRQLYLYIVGLGEPHELDIRIDGVRVARFTVGGEGKGLTTPESFAGNTQGDPDWEVYMHTADEHLRVRVPVTAGLHEVSVSFVRRHWEPEGILQPPQRGFAKTTNELYHGHPAVDTVAITGPIGDARSARTASASGDPPSRARLFVCRPSGTSADAAEACARRILAPVAARAYRRAVTAPELERILAFYREGRTDGGFDRGIQRGLERILASPNFIFRVVHEPSGLTAGTPFTLDDGDLASRLSFFLWSSVPDAELASAAASGRLRQPAALERQVRRMLTDRRAQALVAGFAFQWLKVGKVAGVVPDVDAFPDFDENLRRAMLEETRLFVADQLRSDRGVLDIVTADYSFLNDRLARHYGVAGIYGSHFRKVTFGDGARGGVLGQAAVLTATSYPNRTSPVLRGRWILDTLLGAPPPPPPPDVPSLEETAAKSRTASLREQMETHRRNPACATCHVRMDPLGFSLEHFDALGKWRTTTAAGPIDATAALPDGSRFDGARGLRTFVAQHREDFVRTVSEKLLAYAIGRGLDAPDMPAVRRIVREAEAQEMRWSALILGVVNSAPFRMAAASGSGTQTRAAVDTRDERRVP